MPFFGDKMRELQAGFLALLLVFALALVGVFLLGTAAVDLIANYLSREAAVALVGAVALAPLVVIMFGTLLKSHRIQRELAQAPRSAFMESSDIPHDIRDLIETVQRLTRTAPIAALALAVVAGIVVIRFPAQLALVVAAFKGWQASTHNSS